MSRRVETWVLSNGMEHRRGREPRAFDPNFTIGITKPTSANTGAITPEAELAANYPTFTGELTTTAAGQVIENRVIYGTINVRHSDVTIRNCVVVMPAWVSGASVIGIRVHTAGVSGVVVDRVTVRVPTANQSWRVSYCIQGSGITVTRCDLSGAVDGISKAGINQRSYFEEYGCWIHDLPYDPSDPGHNPPGSHNDANQVEGNLTRCITRGSRYQTGSTSAVLITRDNAGGAYDTAPVFEQMWFEVGDPTFGAIFNVKASMEPIPGLRLARSRFPRDYPTKARIIAYPNHLAVMDITSHGLDRNVFDDGTAADPNPADVDVVPLYNGTTQLRRYGAAA